jgi:hypothetical protein
MKYFIVIPLVIFTFINIKAQDSAVPLLEREVTINAINETIENILADMSNQAGFVFSYNPEGIQSSNKTSISVKGKSVRYVLTQLFDNDVQYKVKGKYIILRGARKKETDSKKIEGYVYDSQTGEKLVGASIYDKELLASAVTDKYGYFSMEIPANKELSAIHISKVGYIDTVISSQANEKHLKTIEVTMNSRDPNQRIVKQVLNKIQFSIPQWLVPSKTRIHSLNLSDSLFRAVQFSVLPFVSTNRFLGGNVVNDVSVNLTIGYNKGVKKMEYGGVLNIDRYDASYMQFAGVGNIVGRELKGIQAAGVFNVARIAEGVQAAGVFNFAQDKANVQLAGVLNKVSFSNLQIAGVLNFGAKSNIQISGYMNQAKIVKQLQIAGALNFAEDVRVIQASGVLNYAGNYAGQQYAGVLNSADSSIIQVAGCYNNANQVVNVQISGAINRACYVKGLQLGVINIADTCAGVPIGVFSYVRDGYHRLEISADEIFPANISFRSGTKNLYSIYSAGTTFNSTNNPLWSFGYGLGTSFGRMDKLLFDFDITANQLMNGSNLTFGNNLYKLNIGIDRRIFRKVSVAFGVSYNFMVTDTYLTSYNEFYAGLPPYTLTDKTNEKGYNHKTWIGGKVALRFF